MHLNRNQLRKLLLKEVALLSEQNIFGNQPGGAELDKAIEHLKAAQDAILLSEATSNQYLTPELDEVVNMIEECIVRIAPNVDRRFTIASDPLPHTRGGVN